MFFFLIIITLGYIFVLFYTANRNERKKPVIYPSNQKKDTRLSLFFLYHHIYNSV